MLLLLLWIARVLKCGCYFDGLLLCSGTRRFVGSIEWQWRWCSGKKLRRSAFQHQAQDCALELVLTAARLCVDDGRSFPVCSAFRRIWESSFPAHFGCDQCSISNARPNGRLDATCYRLYGIVLQTHSVCLCSLCVAAVWSVGALRDPVAFFRRSAGDVWV